MEQSDLTFYVTFVIAKDGRQYSGLCYEYNVAACGETVAETLTELADATISYLEFYLAKGQKPKPRPASLELLLEFLDLDPRRESYSKEEIGQALRSVFKCGARLNTPLIYSLRKRSFEKPLSKILRRPCVGNYPVAICSA